MITPPIDASLLFNFSDNKQHDWIVFIIFPIYCPTGNMSPSNMTKKTHIVKVVHKAHILLHRLHYVQ